MKMELVKDCIYIILFIITVYGVFRTSKNDNAVNIESNVKMNIKLDTIIDSQKSLEVKLDEIERSLNTLENRVTRLETRVFND